MAAGYPNKITRAALGPTYENLAKVTNPKKQLDATAVNLLLWQTAGLNGPAAKGLVYCSLAGTIVTVNRQWFSWDADGALAKMQFTRTGTGVFTWALPGSGSYPDVTGTSIAADLFATIPFLQGTTNDRASAAVNSNGISGTLNVFDADSGAALDPTNWLQLFY